MVLHGMLPIGSVVILKESTKKVMIAGYLQQLVDNGSSKIYEYAGVPFPEGYFRPDTMFVFNADQIDDLYMLGFQDAEQMLFKQDVDAQLLEIRKNEEGLI